MINLAFKNAQMLDTKRLQLMLAALLVVVVKEGRSPSKESILGFLEGKIAKWWMPDDVMFIDEIPHTATGKIQKTALRETLKDYSLPTA